MPSVLSRSAILALGLLLPLLTRADDAYLREIEDEAKRQSLTLTTTQPPPRPNLGPATATASERLASGLDRPGFDQALRAGASKEQFAAFQRLTPRDQQQVYESYRTDSRLTAIGEQITKLGTAKPKP